MKANRKPITENRKPQVTRPNWDTYFMDLAVLASKRATCLRRKVGAFIVKDRHILSTGYNGAPKGIKHCQQAGCVREKLNIPSGQRHELCRALHAEQNAFLQAARHGVNLDGATLYVTVQPCAICAKMIINAGISKIVIEGEDPDEFAVGFLKDAGVEMMLINL